MAVPEEADWRLWLVRLDDALEGRLARGERRFARKDARNLVEDLAFRFALLDDRVVPEDRDFARALAAVKPPALAAEVLARRRPAYRRKHVAGVARTWTILLVLALAAWGVTQFAATERAEPLAAVSHAEPQPVTGTQQFVGFTVPAGLQRVDVTVHASNMNAGGEITVRLMHASSEVVYERTFSREGRVYDHANLAPTAGAWYVVVDYVGAKGAVRVDVAGIRAS